MPTTLKCCECNSQISNAKPLAVLCRCSKPICVSCYDRHNNRAQSEKWYSQYIGVCDTCIWFDIS